jgi:hypothetical protein
MTRKGTIYAQLIEIFVEKGIDDNERSLRDKSI